jgi:hypothetical protein
LSGDNIEEHPPDGDLRQRYLHRMEPTSDEEKKRGRRGCLFYASDRRKEGRGRCISSTERESSNEEKEVREKNKK